MLPRRLRTALASAPDLASAFYLCPHPHSLPTSQLLVYLLQSRLHRAPALHLPLPHSQGSPSTPGRSPRLRTQPDNQNPVCCGPHPSLQLHISLLVSKQIPL